MDQPLSCQCQPLCLGQALRLRARQAAKLPHAHQPSGSQQGRVKLAQGRIRRGEDVELQVFAQEAMDGIEEAAHGGAAPFISRQ